MHMQTIHLYNILYILFILYHRTNVMCCCEIYHSKLEYVQMLKINYIYASKHKYSYVIVSAIILP